MISRLGVVFAILLFLSISRNARGSSDESSEGSSTPAAYLQYKVKALNTALYYILQALHDDLADGIEEVDVSFLKRINIVIVKIKSFYGTVDETNALMLGELLKALPKYLNINMELAGLNFNDYTAMPSTDSFGTISTSTSINTDNTDGGFSADNAEETDNTDEQDSVDSVDSVDSFDSDDSNN